MRDNCVIFHHIVKAQLFVGTTEKFCVSDLLHITGLAVDGNPTRVEVLWRGANKDASHVDLVDFEGQQSVPPLHIPCTLGVFTECISQKIV